MTDTSGPRLPMPDLPPGRVLPVVVAADPVLATRCVEVDPADPEIVQLAADLVTTMLVSPGCVGLAANQVGVGKGEESHAVIVGPRAVRGCAARSRGRLS